MDIIWILVLIGTVIGVGLSSFLGIYNEYAIDVYSRSYFGIPANDLIYYSVILLAIPVLSVLITLSVIVRDLDYPKSMPWNFTIETLVMSILPAVGILLIPLLRGYKYTNKTYIEFGLVILRFGVIHILLQFSGFWSDFFPPIQNKTA